MKTHYPDGTPTFRFLAWGMLHYTAALLYAGSAIVLFMAPPDIQLDNQWIAKLFGAGGLLFIIHAIKIMGAHKP
jgi:hypothetical protein